MPRRASGLTGRSDRPPRAVAGPLPPPRTSTGRAFYAFSGRESVVEGSPSGCWIAAGEPVARAALGGRWVALLGERQVAAGRRWVAGRYSQEKACIFMNFNGFQWIASEFNGFQWISMVFTE